MHTQLYQRRLCRGWRCINSIHLTRFCCCFFVQFFCKNETNLVECFMLSGRRLSHYKLLQVWIIIIFRVKFDLLARIEIQTPLAITISIYEGFNRNISQPPSSTGLSSSLAKLSQTVTRSIADHNEKYIWDRTHLFSLNLIPEAEILWSLDRSPSGWAWRTLCPVVTGTDTEPCISNSCLISRPRAPH